jgi:hypothetical protein
VLTVPAFRLNELDAVRRVASERKRDDDRHRDRRNAEPRSTPASIAASAAWAVA